MAIFNCYVSSPEGRILTRPRSITSIGDRTPFTNLLVNAWSRWDFELYRICHQTQGTTSKSVTKHMGTVWVNYGQSMSKFYGSRGLGSQLISTCFEVFGYALRSLAFDASSPAKRCQECCVFVPSL